MEVNFFRRPAVAGELARFVEARLHTDGTANIERILEVRDRFIGHAATPMYALVDPRSEQRLAVFEGPTFDEQEYVAFLRSG